jgi:predicted DNA-binding transcriptional regulator AlpA
MKQIILRIPIVLSRLGYSNTTLYRRIADRLWTKPVKVSANIVGWPEYEVNALVTALIAGMKNKQIKELVETLEVARKKFAFYCQN